MAGIESRVPSGWREALEESEAEADAGLIVPSEVVRQRFRDSLARLEAKKAAMPKREATSRR